MASSTLPLSFTPYLPPSSSSLSLLCARMHHLTLHTSFPLLSLSLLPGPTEFITHVNTIPPSLFSPDSPHFIPGPEYHSTTVSPLATTTDSSVFSHQRWTAGNPTFPILASRLSFLPMYRDFLEAYQGGEKRKAADLVARMLVNKMAPVGFWAVLLVDSIPLLEGTSNIIFPPPTPLHLSSLSYLAFTTRAWTGLKLIVFRLSLFPFFLFPQTPNSSSPPTTHTSFSATSKKSSPPPRTPQPTTSPSSSASSPPEARPRERHYVLGRTGLCRRGTIVSPEGERGRRMGMH
jgi:hypothetical protein